MGRVVATSYSREHTFSKQNVPSIHLVVGLGIEGDCHAGENVQHRSRMHIKPPPPNLRQVHLIDQAVLQEHNLVPGEIGENVTTSDIDLLELAEDTKLHFVGFETAREDALELNQEHPIVVVAGLRNPCPQIEKHRKGLQEMFITRDEERRIVGRKAGVMGIVQTGGVVMPGMRIVVEQPTTYKALSCV